MPFYSFSALSSLKYESIPASSALTKSKNPIAEVFQIFKRERSVAGKALGMRKARRLAIEQNEACGAQIRLKTVLVTPLMLKCSDKVHCAEAGESARYDARGYKHRCIHQDRWCTGHENGNGKLAGIVCDRT